jgi:protein-disulfide isomerase
MNKKILSALLTIFISTSIYANPTIKTSTKPLMKNEVGKLPTSTQSLTQDQIGQIATEYFMKHPEKMLRIIQNVQISMQKAQVNKVKEVFIQNKDFLLKSSYLPVMGHKDAKNTLVFFYDFQCVYCHKMYPHLMQLLKDDPNTKIVFVPLHVFGKASKYANEMGLYLNSIGKFKSFYDALEKGNLIEGKLTDKEVDQVVEKLGVNLKGAKQYMNSKGIQQVISKIDQLQQVLRIQGTPFMFVVPSNESDITLNSIKIIGGYVGVDQLKAEISY